MLRIVETLPAKTHLPLEAWALTELVTLFSIVSTVAHMSQATNGASPTIEHAMEQESALNQAQFERSDLGSLRPIASPSPMSA